MDVINEISTLLEEKENPKQIWEEYKLHHPDYQKKRGMGFSNVTILRMMQKESERRGILGLSPEKITDIEITPFSKVDKVLAKIPLLPSPSIKPSLPEGISAVAPHYISPEAPPPPGAPTRIERARRVPPMAIEPPDWTPEKQAMSWSGALAFTTNMLEKTPLGIADRLFKPYTTTAKKAILGKEIYEENVKYMDMARKKHPRLSQIGGLAGRFVTLALTRQYVGTPAASFVGKHLDPFTRIDPAWIARIIPGIVGGGTTWGLAGLAEEAARQRAVGEKAEVEELFYAPKELLTKTAEEILFGGIWGGTLAIPRALTRIAAAGASRMLWSTMRTLVKKHKLTSEDLINGALEGALAAALASIGAKKAEWQFKNWQRQDFIQKMQGVRYKGSRYKGHLQGIVQSYKSLMAARGLQGAGIKGPYSPELLKEVADFQMKARLATITYVQKQFPPDWMEMTTKQPAYIKALTKAMSEGKPITEAFKVANLEWQTVLPTPEVKPTPTENRIIIIGKDKTLINRVSSPVQAFLKEKADMPVYIVPKEKLEVYGRVGDRPFDINIGKKALKTDVDLNSTILHEAIHKVELGEWNTPSAKEMREEWRAFNWKDKTPGDLGRMGFNDPMWTFKKGIREAVEGTEFMADMGEWYLNAPQELQKQAKPIYDFFDKWIKAPEKRIEGVISPEKVEEGIKPSVEEKAIKWEEGAMPKPVIEKESETEFVKRRLQGNIEYWERQKAQEKPNADERLKEVKKDYKNFIEGKETKSQKTYSDGYRGEYKEAIRKAKTVEEKGQMRIGETAYMEAREEGKVFEQAIEMPELVELAHDILGKYPNIVKTLENKYGVFTHSKGKAKIKLRADIFKDPATASKVLAHEVGHLTDWLPDKTLARGNLLGHLLTLKKHMKSTADNLENAVVQRELRKLTQEWNPFDEKEDIKFTRYRYRPSELYADAISVLLNSPKTLKTIAPTFYNAFFENIAKKPIVQKALLDLNALLLKGNDTILQKREDNILAGYALGDKIYMQAYEEARKTNVKQWLNELQTELLYRYENIYKMTRRGIKKGIKVEPSKDPRYIIEEWLYIDGHEIGRLHEMYHTEIKPLIDAGLTKNDLGLYLQYQRVITERKDIANPYGINRKEAFDQLEKLYKRITPEQKRVLELTDRLIHENLKKEMQEAEKVGFYTPATYKKIVTNEHYAPFLVLDYLDKYVSPYVAEQVGTFKPIMNPATALTLKRLSLIRAIAKQKTKIATLDLLREIDPTNISETARPDRIAINLLEKGERKKYWIDPYIADDLNYSSPAKANAAIAVFKVTNNYMFRPLFVGLNLGFQVGMNLSRDFWRMWKATPDKPLVWMLYQYAKPSTWRVGHARATGKYHPEIQELYKHHILGTTFTSLMHGKTLESTQLGKLLQKYEVITSAKKESLNLLDKIEEVGNTIETVSKLVGWRARKSTILAGKLSIEEAAYEVRNYSGSPAFLKRGRGYYWYNELAPFGNAMKEGMRGDIEMSFRNPRTRVGYWWKTISLNLTAKVLMGLGIAGVFGPKIKRLYENISEYDLTNYSCLPFGETDNGKTIYMRFPQDELGRMWGGLLWKLISKEKNLKTFASVGEYAGGQIPSTAPILEMGVAAYQYAMGQNPYDFYRGRPVLTSDEMKVRGKYGAKRMGKWYLTKFGIRWNYYDNTTDQTWVKVLRHTPLISRLIKVSDYGKIEKEREFLQDIEKEDAEIRLMEKEYINR